MIFEGTWTEQVWTSTDTIGDMYDAYKDGKIPVLHLPAYEYEDTGLTITDESYVTLYVIKESSATVEGEPQSWYEYMPDSAYVGGSPYDIQVDASNHLTISTK